MPQLLSSKKRLRQSIKRRDRNRATRKTVKLAMRAAVDAAKAGDADALQPAVQAAQKAIDKAVKRGALHKNTAGRRKSRLLLRVNRIVRGEQTEADEQAEA